MKNSRHVIPALMLTFAVLMCMVVLADWLDNPDLTYMQICKKHFIKWLFSATFASIAVFMFTEPD